VEFESNITPIIQIARQGVAKHGIQKLSIIIPQGHQGDDLNITIALDPEVTPEERQELHQALPQPRSLEEGSTHLHTMSRILPMPLPKAIVILSPVAYSHEHPIVQGSTSKISATPGPVAQAIYSLRRIDKAWAESQDSRRYKP